MCLNDRKTGDVVTVSDLEDTPYKRKLLNMGFIKGKSVEVVDNSVLYPMVVKIGESRYSLDKKLSQSILVK